MDDVWGFTPDFWGLYVKIGDGQTVAAHPPHPNDSSGRGGVATATVAVTRVPPDNSLARDAWARVGACGGH